jgi:hypothetical protein
MRNFLVALVLLAAVFVVMGFYLDWFSVATVMTEHKTNTTLTVDQDKIREDEEKAKKKLRDLGDSVKDRSREKGKEQDKPPMN